MPEFVESYQNESRAGEALTHQSGHSLRNETNKQIAPKYHPQRDVLRLTISASLDRYKDLF